MQDLLEKLRWKLHSVVDALFFVPRYPDSYKECIECGKPGDIRANYRVSIRSQKFVIAGLEGYCAIYETREELTEKMIKAAWRLASDQDIPSEKRDELWYSLLEREENLNA